MIPPAATVCDALGAVAETVVGASVGEAGLGEAVASGLAGGSGIGAGVREAVFGASSEAAEVSLDEGCCSASEELAGTTTRFASAGCAAICAEGFGAVADDVATASGVVGEAAGVRWPIM